MTLDTTVADFDGSERQRLAECAREPIRTPGAIQPHGALLAVDASSLIVTVISENCAELIGAPASPLGLPLAEVAGADFTRRVQEAVADPDTDVNPLPVTLSGRTFDAIVHDGGQLLIVELEPVLPISAQPPTSELYALIHRIAKSTDAATLRADAARGLRALTGFDRVMIYHFHPDGHGEVVAEDRAEEMEPYLGLHYPASDIPAQARELYLTKLSRAIVGTSGESADLLSLDGEATRGRLDLSTAELRSVSPHHLAFMRNMGQESTLSFSIVREGVLIGMITCAHRSALRLPFLLRRGIEILANQIALQLSALEQLERLRRQVAVRRTRSALMAQVAGASEIAESLVQGTLTVNDVIDADGVAVRIEGRTVWAGQAPPTAELDTLARFLAPYLDDGPFVSDALRAQHPGLWTVAPSVTGVLFVRIGGAGDYLAFFRDEVLQTVDWLGDQTPANRETPLSPRTSFSAWTASVTGTSLPWDDLPAEAAELARDIEGALFRRAESELAHLALFDPLTGLPNRRQLLDRIALALTTWSTVRPVAMLFVDLDGFKAVNDTYGHDAGDALISVVGRRILAATRQTDVVARIGGDEFVVLCEETGEREAAVVAARVLDLISQPIEIGDASISITASVGTAVADEVSDAAGLLRHADEAMYRAKDSGKNRASS